MHPRIPGGICVPAHCRSDTWPLLCPGGRCLTLACHQHGGAVQLVPSLQVTMAVLMDVFSLLPEALSSASQNCSEQGSLRPIIQVISKSKTA